MALLFLGRPGRDFFVGVDGATGAGVAALVVGAFFGGRPWPRLAGEEGAEVEMRAMVFVLYVVMWRGL